MIALPSAEPMVPDDRAALLEVALSARLVNKIAQAIAAQRAVSDLIKTAVEHTRVLCEADGASLLLLDPETSELSFDRVDGAGAGRIEHRQRLAAEQARLGEGNGLAGGAQSLGPVAGERVDRRRLGLGVEGRLRSGLSGVGHGHLRRDRNSTRSSRKST